MKVIKTLALDIPYGRKVVSTIDDGKSILFENMSSVKLPKGKWLILSVEDGIIHLLPKSKTKAIREGWIS